MDSPLAQIQQQAEAHFTALARTRDTSAYPVFALEHGLSKAQLAKVSSMLQSTSGEKSFSPRYWLLWVIYATEFGYDYEGSEYWLSFENQTPGWQYHDRAKIKAWFRRFQKTYSGVTPRGPWAERFNIIAWPITHAILPRYLQRQFAKLLYDLRYSLAFAESLDERRIGRLLALHVRPGYPSRFRAFLEQEELTGQIVAALLGAGTVEDDLIHDRTLERVISDVEAARNAREWLSETQRLVADRFKGIGRGTGPTRRHDDGSPASPASPRLAIQPNLWLRHAGKGRWSVFLEIKSFRSVAAHRTALHTFLNNTRCRLNGARDFKPAGWLLSGDRKGALTSWPDPQQPLILFEQHHPTMDHLLQSECRFRADPPWLFRLGTDGNARHIASPVVRPGSDYIVVTTMPPPKTLEGISECDLHCEGVNAYRLSVPPSVSAEMTGRLKMEGLAVARTIHVWPAGLPGRGWDGEGCSEWLTTESPCFGIACDHPVEALSFSLNKEPERLIQANNQDRLFVRLPPLPAGVHTMTVEAKRSVEFEGVTATAPAKGFVQLAVREPVPWTPGVTSHHGLIVRADPEHADLDTFWQNKLSLSVNGPEGFAATFIVGLQSDDGREILSEQVGTIDLPVQPDMWRSTFGRFLDHETRPWKYLEAQSCTLTIRAEGLGTCTLRFEHDPLPVRWLARSLRGDVVVRLVDDCGQDDHPVVHFYSMAHPIEPHPLEPQSVQSYFAVTPPGGLYVAKLGLHTDAVVVSAPPAGMQDLQVNPLFPPLHRSATALSKLWHLLGHWHGARRFGFLLKIRLQRVVDDLSSELYSSMCGKKWTDAEVSFRRTPRPNTANSLSMLADNQDGGFGVTLQKISRASTDIGRLSDQFLATAARYGVSNDRQLCNFALLLAHQPHVAVLDPDFDSLVAKLLDNPAVLRGARLLALLGDENIVAAHSESPT